MKLWLVLLLVVQCRRRIMDRIGFIQSIDRTPVTRSLTDDIVDYFDQEMLLYEIIGGTNLMISVTDCTTNNISFHIDGNKQDISFLSNRLALFVSSPVVEYDKPLVVQSSVISDKSIEINISNI